MMARLFFAPQARLDLVEIEDYIARDKPIAALEWVGRLEEKCRLIADQPGLGEHRPDLRSGLYCSMLGRYLILYRKKEDCVEVMRVVTGDRDLKRLF
jgi:toxin ParE1/3/4